MDPWKTDPIWLSFVNQAVPRTSQLLISPETSQAELEVAQEKLKAGQVRHSLHGFRSVAFGWENVMFCLSQPQPFKCLVEVGCLFGDWWGEKKTYVDIIDKWCLIDYYHYYCYAWIVVYSQHYYCYYMLLLWLGLLSYTCFILWILSWQNNGNP